MKPRDLNGRLFKSLSTREWAVFLLDPRPMNNRWPLRRRWAHTFRWLRMGRG